MEDKEYYPREKFSMANRILAGDDDIRGRIYEAFMHFHPVVAADFRDPADAAMYRSIKERLTSVRTGRNGWVAKTLDAMDDATAHGIAEDIKGIHERLKRKYGDD